MIRPGWKSLLLGVVVAVTLASATSQADAHWGWGRAYCGWGCYTPCWTASYCDPCCDSGWYAWRPGLVRRGWWGCGYRAGCWSSCYSSCDPCYSVVSCCGEVAAPAGVPTQAAPTTPVPPPPTTSPASAKAPELPPPEPPAPAKTPAGGDMFNTPTPPAATPPAATPPAATPPAEKPAKPAAGGLDLDTPAVPSVPGGAGTSMAPALENSGLLTIYVPAAAKVTINGLPTRSMGSKRQYVSFGLQPGYTYKYVVVASIVRDGQLIEDSRTVTLTAGSRDAVAFGFNPPADESLASN